MNAFRVGYAYKTFGTASSPLPNMPERQDTVASFVSTADGASTIGQILASGNWTVTSSNALSGRRRLHSRSSTLSWLQSGALVSASPRQTPSRSNTMYSQSSVNDDVDVQTPTGSEQSAFFVQGLIRTYIFITISEAAPIDLDVADELGYGCETQSLAVANRSQPLGPTGRAQTRRSARAVQWTDVVWTVPNRGMRWRERSPLWPRSGAGRDRLGAAQKRSVVGAILTRDEQRVECPTCSLHTHLARASIPASRLVMRRCLQPLRTSGSEASRLDTSEMRQAAIEEQSPCSHVALPLTRFGLSLVTRSRLPISVDATATGVYMTRFKQPGHARTISVPMLSLVCGLSHRFRAMYVLSLAHPSVLCKAELSYPDSYANFPNLLGSYPGIYRAIVSVREGDVNEQQFLIFANLGSRSESPLNACVTELAQVDWFSAIVVMQCSSEMACGTVVDFIPSEEMICLAEEAIVKYVVVVTTAFADAERGGQKLDVSQIPDHF
ncbi:hypothetical protein FA95DRAFT_1575814 [Auriscalpium vulgare]|uniref:Uncharacterized protein n=1 Tax=Auriscalpium vulgare TaxID=40419 RepID=A0ACB8RFF1_9AGAM|nr:hypothetical protein FA95DRAFT_1575814 [Auriscalpium vulgare]